MSETVIKINLGGTGVITPHPDDKSEAAEAIRKALKESTPEQPDIKAG